MHAIKHTETFAASELGVCSAFILTLVEVVPTITTLVEASMKFELRTLHRRAGEG